ncbi:MAG TPA: tol-pal system protein YbgF [Candidatus Acidoferrales bacterium]|nr:tol-pal system protein YbgF [Candidatus Acidoferrales bacterium]
MRARTILISLGIFLAGALVTAMLTPAPANAVSREIIQIQQSISQILQNQQDARSDVDSKLASMQTLVQQSLDASGRLSQTMGALQKTVQDAQANSGANNSNVAQQVQGVSDNLQDLQARVAKLAQQMSDMESTLQSINARVSTGAPAMPAQTSTTSNMESAPSSTAPVSAPSNAAPPAASPAQQTAATQPAATTTAPATTAPAATAPASTLPPPPISADTLYANAQRDLNSGNNTLSRQEFSDYLKDFPNGPFAADAQFYLGEICYEQSDYNGAIDAYDNVIMGYPNSLRVASAMLEKGRALQETGKKASAQAVFRQLVQKFPGTDEARKAQAELSQPPQQQ